MEAAIFFLVVLAITSSSEAGQLKACVEDDICQAIVFNQMALATIQEEVKHLTGLLNDTKQPVGVDQNWALENCRDEKEGLRTQLLSLQVKSKKWMADASEPIDEDDDLQTQVENVTRTNNQLANENNNLRVQVENMRRTNSQLVNENNDLQTQVEDVTRTKMQLSNENTDLRLQVQSLTRTVSQLANENQHLLESLAEKEAQIKNLTVSLVPTDCADVQIQGQTESGVYTIYPFQTDESIEVLCDLESNGGGWTVFFTRQPQDEPLDFNESWENFKRGFGNVNTEYWMGNDFLHTLTSRGTSSLRVDAENFSGERRWAEWNVFSIANEDDEYKVHIAEYSTNSTMGDSLIQNTNSNFTTFDMDNDNRRDVNCALGSPYASWGQGGWWYKGCGSTRPTAPLRNTNYWDSACWQHWNTHGSKVTSFKTLSMKIRRQNYEEIAVVK